MPGMSLCALCALHVHVHMHHVCTVCNVVCYELCCVVCTCCISLFL